MKNKSKKQTKKSRFTLGIYQKEAEIIKIFKNGFCVIKWGSSGGYLASEIAGFNLKKSFLFNNF